MSIGGHSSMPKLSVVVPCYNEAANIPHLFAAFLPVLQAEAETEIIFVNNGSTDNSAEVFRQELSKYNDPRYKICKVELNQGYGYGILAGLKDASADILGWTHADLQTDPMDVIRAYQTYDKQNKYLLVKGHRCKRKITEAFFSWGMQIISSLALGTALSEINAQPKLFSRYFYEELLVKDAPWDFSLDLYALYLATKQGSIISIPVYFKKRLYGEAKGGGSFKTKIKLIKRTWAYIFKLRKEIHEHISI